MKNPFKTLEQTAPGTSDISQKPETQEQNEAKDVPVSSFPETLERDSSKADTNKEIEDDNGEKIGLGGMLVPGKTFVLNGIEYKTDDRGKIFSIDGKYIPDSAFLKDGREYAVEENGRIFKRDGIEYKTDDLGMVYRIDGRNAENTSFVINGKKYQTDNSGKLVSFDGKPLSEIDYSALDKADFNELKCFLSDYYAEKVNSNEPWKWCDIPGGETLTAGQREKIKEYARDTGAVPVAPVSKEGEIVYADFSEFSVFECTLEKDKWKSTDSIQFDDCNQKLKADVENNDSLAGKFTKEQLQDIKEGKTPRGYTWHHSEKDGVMQLVPFGVHNSTYHNGGRSEGNWADAPRY